LEAARGLPVSCVHFEDLVASPRAVISRVVDDLRGFGVALASDVDAAAASLRHELVHDDATPNWMRRATSATQAAVRALPSSSQAFAPPAGHEPAWVGPLLYAYRGPWVVRSRFGHPLRTGADVTTARPEA
jgi:hypothetical protein